MEFCVSQDIAATMTLLRDLQGIWPDTLLTWVATLALVSDSGRMILKATRH
jgi:hypothetical protein